MTNIKTKQDESAFKSKKSPNEFITSNQIFRNFEQKAIEWGKQFQIAKVGEIVKHNRGKRIIDVMISSVSVTIGRNAQKTILKTLVLEYSGMRIKKDGTLFDSIGSGIFLSNFETAEGRRYDYKENGVTEAVNDAGLSFYIDFEKETKKTYPLAYNNYKDGFYPYNR